MPDEYGLVLISGKAGSAKTAIAKIIRWTLLGENASNEDISTPKWASDWKTTKTEITFKQKEFDGNSKKYVLSRTKNKNSNGSVLTLNVDGGLPKTDQSEIISDLINITNLKLNSKISAYTGEQDRKWWFYKAELQTLLLQEFEKTVNYNAWSMISGTDKLTKRLEHKQKSIESEIQNMPGWSTSDKLNLDKWTHERDTNLELMKQEEGKVTEHKNAETAFKKENPNWKTYLEDTSSVHEAFQALSQAETAIGDNKFDSSDLIKHLNSSVSIALDKTGLNDKIPSKDPKKVMDALSTVVQLIVLSFVS